MSKAIESYIFIIKELNREPDIGEFIAWSCFGVEPLWFKEIL